MLITNHVLAGATIGRILRHRPGAAFSVGVVSHLVMDSMPHWGQGDDAESDQYFVHVATRDGLAGLVAAGATALLAADARIPVVCGITGAVLLDLRHPSYHFWGFSPFPAAVDRLHARVQHGMESPRRMRQEVLLAGALTVMVAWWLAAERATRRAA